MWVFFREFNKCKQTGTQTRTQTCAQTCAQYLYACACAVKGISITVWQPKGQEEEKVNVTEICHPENSFDLQHVTGLPTALNRQRRNDERCWQWLIYLPCPRISLNSLISHTFSLVPARWMWSGYPCIWIYFWSCRSVGFFKKAKGTWEVGKDTMKEKRNQLSSDAAVQTMWEKSASCEGWIFFSVGVRWTPKLLFAYETTNLHQLSIPCSFLFSLCD